MPDFIAEEVAPKDYETIQEDLWLPAKVTKVENRKKPFQDEGGNDIWKVNFSFTITDGEYEGRRIYGDTNTTFNTHPDCRLRAWASEILGGIEITKDFKLNTDTLIDLPCRVQVGHRVRKAKHPGEEDGVGIYVKDVMRPRAGHAGAAQVQPYIDEPF